jgi:hypothetical protein
MASDPKKYMLYFAGLAVVLVLIVVGVHIYPKGASAAGITAGAQATTTGEGNPSATGFQTYTDSAAGFSFQYPASWPAATQTVSDAGTQINFGETLAFAMWDYPISVLGTNMTADTFIAGQEKLPGAQGTPIKIDGRDGEQITYSDQPGSEDFLVPDYQGNIIDIKVFATGDPDAMVDSATVSAILQSFQIYAPGQSS